MAASSSFEVCLIASETFVRVLIISSSSCSSPFTDTLCPLISRLIVISKDYE